MKCWKGPKNDGDSSHMSRCFFRKASYCFCRLTHLLSTQLWTLGCESRKNSASSDDENNNNERKSSSSLLQKGRQLVERQQSGGSGGGGQQGRNSIHILRTALNCTLTIAAGKCIPKRIVNPCLNLNPTSSLKFEMSTELHPCRRLRSR